MKKPNLIAKTFRIPEEITVLAERFAKDNEMTPSQVVRLALKRFLVSEEPTAPGGVVGRGGQCPESGSSLADPHEAKRNVDSRFIYPDTKGQ